MVSGEKRNCDEEKAMEKINTILLDIEGATTSISFVKDTLFPYVRKNLKAYVDSHWDDEEFKADLKALKLQAKKDEEDKIDNFCPILEGENEKDSVIKNVLWQMDLDRKTTALKQLQGHIWREGYENGQLKGHVYPDVAQTLKKWCEEGRKLYIYSSGSVEAQKLLFKNSESGDLQGFLSGYFDTETGPKTEASSYKNIAEAVGCECSQILFLTDVIKEAVAADKAGFQVMLVIREGNAPLTDDEKKAFTTIDSFKDIVFESSNKKKKICEEKNEGQEIPAAPKTENAEAAKEPAETKKEESEKMEVDTNNEKAEDCKQESKTEENGETKTEASTKSSEADSDGIDVDVDVINEEKGSGDKKVSSSAEIVEEKKEEACVNGESEKTTGEAEAEPLVEKTEAKPSEEKMEAEPSEEKAKEEEKVDSTAEQITKEEKEDNKENLEDSSDKVAEKSVNGHENGSHLEENGKEASGEVENSANGKLEEVEAVPVKKVAPEEQADSTVEVTA